MAFVPSKQSPVVLVHVSFTEDTDTGPVRFVLAFLPEDTDADPRSLVAKDDGRHIAAQDQTSVGGC